MLWRCPPQPFFGEGFSNAIGEAMATGIPCVVTDVWGSTLIVGNKETVVPPEDQWALVSGWEKIIMKDGSVKQYLNGRQRVMNQFFERTEKHCLQNRNRHYPY
jgi:glycosyltransferase involved in cell wall biosynthesis